MTGDVLWSLSAAIRQDLVRATQVTEFGVRKGGLTRRPGCAAEESTTTRLAGLVSQAAVAGKDVTVSTHSKYLEGTGVSGLSGLVSSGADLEIAVQLDVNMWMTFLCQAKRLRPDGRYTGVKQQQLGDLAAWARTYGQVPALLLYNGPFGAFAACGQGPRLPAPLKFFGSPDPVEVEQASCGVESCSCSTDLRPPGYDCEYALLGSAIACGYCASRPPASLPATAVGRRPAWGSNSYLSPLGVTVLPIDAAGNPFGVDFGKRGEMSLDAALVSEHCVPWEWLSLAATSLELLSHVPGQDGSVLADGPAWSDLDPESPEQMDLPEQMDIVPSQRRVLDSVALDTADLEAGQRFVRIMIGQSKERRIDDRPASS